MRVRHRFQKLGRIVKAFLNQLFALSRMAWRVARYLVGSLVVLGVAACGKQWLAERESWRHEAEVACLKSGQVKEGLAGPLPADRRPGRLRRGFSLKVAAIGEGSASASPTSCVRPVPSPARASRSPIRRPPDRLFAVRLRCISNILASGLRHSNAYPPQQQPIRTAGLSGAAISRAAALSVAGAAVSAGRATGDGPMSIYAPGVTPPEPDAAEDEPDRARGERAALSAARARRAYGRLRARYSPPSRAPPDPIRRAPIHLSHSRRSPTPHSRQSRSRSAASACRSRPVRSRCSRPRRSHARSCPRSTLGSRAASSPPR